MSLGVKRFKGSWFIRHQGRWIYVGNQISDVTSLINYIIFLRGEI